MKNHDSSKFDLVVIDATAVGKKMCILYHASVQGVDFLESVEYFFEDAGIEVEPETVEKIANEVFHKGFSKWEDFHFEMLIK